VAASSALVPIVVAVIGVVGTFVPIYINNPTSTAEISTRVSLRPTLEHNVLSYLIDIRNQGNAPATNLSIFVRICSLPPPFDIIPCEAKIYNITNGYSTTELLLPQSNKTLEPLETEPVNQPLVKVRTSELAQGPGSQVRLFGFTNIPPGGFVVTVISDQGGNYRDYRIGGTQAPYQHGLYASLPIYVQNIIKWYNDEIGIRFGFGIIDIPEYVRDLIQWFDVNVAPLAVFFIVFYTVLFVILYLYFRRRKAVRKVLTKVIENAIEVRRALQVSHTSKENFAEAWETWNQVPINKRRKAIRDISDYLVVDDFYSELKEWIKFTSHSKDEKVSELSKSNALAKHNEAVLTAAENVLNKVDWNKYR
jgi:hypothetical protein